MRDIKHHPRNHNLFNAKTFLENISNYPGVYQMLGENGEVLYVGKARNLKKRLSSYFKASPKDIKTQTLVKHIRDIDVIITRNDSEALLLECNLIKKHKPRYNILFRDDKSYPYIVITMSQPFPRADFFRGSRKPGNLYFGPYPSAKSVRETINLIEKLFRLRTCADHFFSGRARPCLLHQLGRCSGPCAGLISSEDYQLSVQHAILFLQGKNEEIIEDLNLKMETASKNLNFELAAKYRDQISKLREIQEKQYVSGSHGEADVIGYSQSAGIFCIYLLTIRTGRILGGRSYFPTIPLNATAEEIITSFITQHYFSKHDIPKEIILENSLPDQNWLVNALTEQAQHKVMLSNHVRGEKKKWLEMASSSAKQALITYLISKTNTKERFEKLKELLALTKIPTRIECFDISHSMGEATVASCVVFNSQGPVKSDYRRFNITDVTPGDDIGAMKQALFRRYHRLQKENATLPTILIIDGGVAQLNAALDVLKQLNIDSILLISIAKGITRKPGYEILHRPNQEPISLPPDSLALHLLQQIRDEAHRFAITGHRHRRDKKRRTSTLELIPGIGAKRRRELLRYFGGIQALKRASLDELTKVPGISLSLAQRIFAILHDVTV